MNVIEAYATDSSNKRRYLGTIGGSTEETKYNFKDDVNPIVFNIKKDDVIDFVYKDRNNNADLSSQLLVSEQTGNNYNIKVMNKARTEELASVMASLVPDNTKNDLLAIDPTKRQNSDDTYFYIEANKEFLITIDAIGAYINTLGFIKIDLDPLTGVATHGGYKADTYNFDMAVRQTLDTASVGFETQKLDPFTENINALWTASTDGYYAPAMITEENHLFVLNHTLDSSTTHTRMAGEYTVAFEDTLGNKSDFDFNDIAFKLTPQFS